MSRRENKVTSKVVGGWLYLEDGEIALESDAWWAWLRHGGTFYVETPDGTFTAQCEGRRGGYYWYAVRWQQERRYKLYLGTAAQLTRAHLAAAAQVLADKSGA